MNDEEISGLEIPGDSSYLQIQSKLKDQIKYILEICRFHVKPFLFEEQGMTFRDSIVNLILRTG